MKGSLLIPSTVITTPNWIQDIKCFIDKYDDELPSRLTLDAELIQWTQLWNGQWEEKLKILKEQHTQATGTELKVSPSELTRLKINAVPCNISATLKSVKPDLFPNIYYLLGILAVLPVTSCEAEHCISSLRHLKTYLRSTMGQDRLTGLALMYIHKHIHINIDDIVTQFAIMHPRRMRLVNIFND